MCKACATFAVLLSLAQGCAVQSERQAAGSLPSEPTAQATVVDPVATPELVLRQFLIAVFKSDEAAIRRTALARPDMEVLWVVPSPPPAKPLTMFERGFVMLVVHFLPVRRVRVGEVLTLPGDLRMHVNENDVNDGRLLLEVLGFDLPFILVKTDGRWRVDPGPVINVRLKAQELRQRPHNRGRPPYDDTKTRIERVSAPGAAPGAVVSAHRNAAFAD